MATAPLSDAVHPRAIDVGQWAEDNKNCFVPPVCNKLMYKMRGNMELPIVQQGKRRLIQIKEGQVFLLPSRIPHAPQRPEEGSLGLVIERSRTPGEIDGLRWYTDFQTCDEILYEKYFQCEDLGKDLVPVVQGFKASSECASGRPSTTSVLHPVDRPLRQDVMTAVWEPFSLQDWIDRHSKRLAEGEAIDLFQGHPDQEFKVMIVGGAGESTPEPIDHETWFYQLEGTSLLCNLTTSRRRVLQEGECCIIPSSDQLSHNRPYGSITMVVTQNPLGNKRAQTPHPKQCGTVIAADMDVSGNHSDSRFREQLP